MKIFLVLLFVTSVASADPVAGKKVWKKVNCTSCHKKDGMGKAKKKKDGTYRLGGMFGPRINGLKPEYIVEQVTAIQSGKRKTKYTISMKSKVKKLTEKDIKDVADYIYTKLAKGKSDYKSEIWPRKK